MRNNDLIIFFLSFLFFIFFLSFKNRRKFFLKSQFMNLCKLLWFADLQVKLIHNIPKFKYCLQKKKNHTQPKQKIENNNKNSTQIYTMQKSSWNIINQLHLSTIFSIIVPLRHYNGNPLTDFSSFRCWIMNCRLGNVIGKVFGSREKSLFCH